MILFTILLSILIAVVAVALIASIIAGGSFLVIFGDAIVFGVLVWVIVTICKELS